MKILHICTQDSGGAGNAARRLCLGLKLLGIKSKMLVLDRNSTDSDVVETKERNDSIFRKIINKIRYKLICMKLAPYKHTIPKNTDMFTITKSLHKIGNHPLVKEADIINLHWVAGMINYNEFFQKVSNKPIVWTLHDSNPFTGGCHVPGDCMKYQTGCGQCPQLGSKNKHDLSRKVFKIKQKSYKNKNIHAVVASKLYANRISNSELFKNFQYDLIPLGIPRVMLNPHNKNDSRDIFNLPKDKTLILLGSDRQTENKGFNYLIEALKEIKNRTDLSKIGLVNFGNYKQNMEPGLKEVGCSFSRLGYIQDQALLSSAYSSCDMFINPSLEESFGLTCFEAMAAGIPAISFKTGGMADIAIAKKAILVAELKNTKDLADKIEYMITHPKEREEMGQNARKLIEQEYTLQVQAERYLKLYERLFSSQNKSYA